MRLKADRLAQAGRKAVQVGPAGWLLLAEAQVALLKASRAVRRTPTGELVSPSTLPVSSASPSPVSPTTAPSAAPPADDERRRVEAVGEAVERMARLGLSRPLCLVRALALHGMLERRGVQGARIRVGVRMAPGGFEAHAWVEWQGEVVGEDPAYPAQFRPIEVHGGDPSAPGLAGLHWAPAPPAQLNPRP